MGRVTWGIPERLLDAVVSAGELAGAVETGTHRGTSTRLLARRFPQVVTIEADATLAREAAVGLAGFGGVRVVHGDSRDVLPGLVAEFSRPALFWLDGHFCGSDTYGRDRQCPVLAEIATIVASPVPHVILVDDARLFLAPPPRPLDPGQWPSIAELCRAIDRGIVARHVAVHDDVVVAMPEAVYTGFGSWLVDVADEREAAPHRTIRARLRRRLDRLLGRGAGGAPA